MSQRVQRASTRKQTAAAADEDASMKPAAGRKRAAAKLKDESASAAADESPAAKRARGRHSPVVAAVADEEEPAAAAKSKKKKEPTVDLVETALDSFRTATAGHMFGAALTQQQSSRPSLPLWLLFSTFDFLSLRDIACRVVVTSRAGYATAVEYALLVKSNAERKEVSEEDPSSHAATSASSASSSSSSSSSSVFAMVDAQTPAPTRLGVRSDQSMFSIAHLTLLLSSRLRGMVTTVRTALDRQSLTYIDVKGLPLICQNLPQLKELQCRLHSAVVNPTLVFPPNLHSLSVELEYFIAPHLSKKDRASRNSPPPKSWSAQKCDELTMCVMEAIARDLPGLTHLHFGVASGMDYSLVAPHSGWLNPLVGGALAKLQSISFSQNTKMNSLAKSSITQLRALPSLTRIVSFGPGFGTALPLLLASPLPFPRMHELCLGSVPVTDDLRAPLLALRESLTNLCPPAFVMKDLGWVANFTKLTTIHLAASYGIPPVYPPVNNVVALLLNMPQLTDVFLAYPDLDDLQLASVLATLTKLRSLTLQSKTVTTLEAFSTNKHLAKTLTRLAISVPNVPRDHVQHLLALEELVTLNIAGSFKEPLFATQLYPFQRPYPKQPLHWLRSFIPRSSNEAVPAPPVNLAAVAAAQVEFGLRVQAGEVCAAELLNSAQLSGVMQFLSNHDFCLAGRACRAWRTAASLPSAWGMVDRSSESRSSGGGSGGGKQLVPIAAALGASSNRHPSSLFFSSDPAPPTVGHLGRCLRLRRTAPQCTPAILPQLPQWKHVRSLELLLEQYNGDSSAAAFEAVGMLGRLESLSLDCSGRTKDSDFFAKMIATLGPHLRRLTIATPPLAILPSLTAVQQLELNFAHAYSSPSNERKCPGLELACLTSLRRLIVTAEEWADTFPATIRRLSVAHALRELDIRVLTPPYIQAQPGAPRLDDRQQRAKAFQESLMAQLAGAPPGVETAIVAVAAPAASTAIAATAVAIPAISGLDDDEPAAAAASSYSSSSSSPALLESLRVDLQWHPSKGDEFSLKDLLRLPRLRSLEFVSKFAHALGLASLESATTGSTTIPPIENLSIRICGPASANPIDLANLARLTQLRKLRLFTQYAASVQLPLGCLQRWSTHLTNLQVLMLNSSHLESGALGGLAGMASLRALSITDQPSMQPRDFRILPTLPNLQELELADIANLPIQRREWMEEIRRTGEEEKKKKEEADVDETKGGENDVKMKAAAADSSSADDAPSLVDLLSSCRSLRVFRWAAARRVMDANADYTLDRSWWTGSRVTVAEQTRRADTERARQRQALREVMKRLQQQHAQEHCGAPRLFLRFETPAHVSHVLGTLAVLELAPEAEGADRSKRGAAAASVQDSASLLDAAAAAKTPGQKLALTDAAMLAKERELEAAWGAEARAAEQKRANKQAQALAKKAATAAAAAESKKKTKK